MGEMKKKGPAAMASDYTTHFAEPSNVRREILTLRKNWGTGITDEAAQQAWKTLSLMLIYCPRDMFDLVSATMAEFQDRMAYMNIDYLGEL